jgi:hypothetical protein
MAISGLLAKQFKRALDFVDQKNSKDYLEPSLFGTFLLALK